MPQPNGTSPPTLAAPPPALEAQISPPALEATIGQQRGEATT
jgi:hypothetical protein